MQSSLQLPRRLTQLASDLPCQLLAKRFGGGGGGRPGGRPAFNWREKMELRLNSKKEKKVTLQPFGDFKQIEKQLGQNDFVVTLKGPDSTKLNQQEIKNLFKSDVNTMKVIDVKQLFGSHKVAGMLPHKHNKKQAFSHRRVFGQKKATSAKA